MTGFHPWWPWPAIHPHLVFEVLAYALGFRLYRRVPATGLPTEQRIWLLVAAATGAAVGAKLLFWLEDPAATWAHRMDLSWLFSGRTIVGALLGGWAGTELAKRRLGVTIATGDAWVAPLAVGMAVGRIGCFFSGVTDGTHGVETQLPLGMDLGDGVPRHPTALYEIAWLAVSGAAAGAWTGAKTGDRFLAFMAGYLAFRLVVEALKTQPTPWWGLSSIQVACVAGLAYTGAVAWRRAR